MRILGNGVDIVENRRIEKAIKNKNFVNKIFSTKEKDIAKNKRVNKTNYFAKRFAAKEAFLKAVGSAKKIKFNEIEVRNNSSGAPRLTVKSNSLKNLKKIFKKKKFKIHLSLSDDKPWAVASVIIFIYN